MSGVPDDPEVGARAPRSTPLFAFMLASFAVGAFLMLAFDATLARIAGVLALVAFILAGVFLIADPAFLAGDDEPG